MRIRLASAVSILALITGCSSGQVITPSADPDTGAADDTGSMSIDTGVDTAVPVEDTNVAVDSGADTSSAEDSASPDTADTSSADSSSADAADTSSTDTADTSSADTSSADSASDAADTAEVCVPSTEICDNLDNNCNGSVDEGITRSCYTGPAGTMGVGQCLSGTQACAAGSFPTACTGEVLPGIETCNGVDQDCDGTVDDGCPASVAFTAAALTAAHGGTGGTLYADRCAAGYAVSAIRVTVNAYLRRVQVTCSSIAVAENTTAMPYSYSLTVGATVNLTERGTFTGTVATAQCPANTFAYGISGRAGGLIDGITLHCASLALTGTAPGSFAITRTAAASSSYVGGSGGSAYGPDSCADNQVAMGIDARVGDGVDNIRLACGTPTIVAK